MDTDLIFCPDVENNSYRPPAAAQYYIWGGNGHNIPLLI